MYLDAILEVAIGLVFTWLVLSIATMQVEEWLSGWFRWRAGLLEKSIHRMLRKGQLVGDFYSHPAIASLTQSGDRPSYIPSDRFAQTLFDVVFNREEGADEESLVPLKPLRLEDVNGIGPDSAGRLRLRGIDTVERLAQLTPEQLEDDIHPLYKRIANEEAILRHAKELLEPRK